MAEPSHGDETVQLLARFMDSVTALVRGIDEVFVSNHYRDQFLEIRDLALRLEGQTREGRRANELIPCFEDLTHQLQLSPDLWLNAPPQTSGPLCAYELHEDVRVAFYALRAHLFPDGKTWTS